jgi:serine/threonine protein phosphatase 1
MLGFLKKRREAVSEALPASIGEQRRVYAIGDIHGRADLLVEILEAIFADNAARSPLHCQIIFLGDLVDRGHQSAQVVMCAMEMARRGAPVRFLKGNHEEVFVRAARGDVKMTRFFCRIGGRETILSYGLPEADYAAMDFTQLAAWMLENIPREHVDFVDGFEDMVDIGDYLFVHAGIRPDVPLDAQQPSDLRWIRDEFLSFREPLGRVVVHGHTITPAVDQRSNRIGIDTGAFQSGRLTAIGLEGTERWFLSTGDNVTVAPLDLTSDDMLPDGEETDVDQ